METLIVAIGKWWWSWFTFGTANVTAYLVVGAVMALAANAVLEWAAVNPAKTMERFFASLVLGAAWPIPLATLSFAVALLPVAAFAYGLWKWQALNARGREKAVDIMQDRADRRRMISGGAAGEEWGKPTPESKSTVERILNWRVL